ncbi:hypothetical protein HanIR_Chr12g0568091 [Helianthus annuus]|nr:hypothetical protein HanIR_Chr12g0568091 [Helianthus annuus]
MSSLNNIKQMRRKLIGIMLLNIAPRYIRTASHRIKRTVYKLHRTNRHTVSIHFTPHNKIRTLLFTRKHHKRTNSFMIFLLSRTVSSRTSFTRAIHRSKHAFRSMLHEFFLRAAYHITMKRILIVDVFKQH